MRPNLLIGLGGAGSKVVTNVYKKFMENNPTVKERDRFVCLCFDTDCIDTRKYSEILPRENVVNIAPDTYLDGVYHHFQRNTTVQNWFDDNIPTLKHSLHEGSAMFRMPLRLAFMDAEEKGKLDIINHSIERLLEHHADINVSIVTSLAGGTGSGIFLQIAYYVKEVMRNHHINTPKITGYFLLAEVFRDVVCHNRGQFEFMQANTYASLRELSAFNRQNDPDRRLPIEFEYRYGQNNRTLPPCSPYDLCYLMGENAGPNYLSRLSEFVFYTVLSPLGEHFQAQRFPYVMRIPPYRRYASLGISKMVYPLDDIVHYFALRYVSEKLTNWFRIDKDFQAEYEKYKKDKREGIPPQEPEKGHFFMTKLEELSITEGVQGTEFRHIYRSAQVLDSDGIQTGTSKAQTYLEEIKNFVTKTVNSNPKLKELYEECTKPDINFTTEENPDKDFQFVTVREHHLNEYKKEVECYIDCMKRIFPKQCFLDDFENENYVSKTPNRDRHHLNTFLLPKDEELHPVAVRCFLYELQELIKPYLVEIEASNIDLWKAIQYYTVLFDNPETDYIENIHDFIESAKQRDSGAKKFLNRITGKRPYKEAKIEYETASRQHAENIHTYTINKLLEETLLSLRDNITRLIEESESFFNQLPDVLKEIDKGCEYFLHKHEVGKEKDITYVLASAQNKEDIYHYDISRNDLPFLPSVMSAEIYRSMYKNVCEELEASMFKKPNIIDSDAKRKSAIESNKKIITEYVDYLDKKIRKEIDHDYFAPKNVMEALEEEAMRECDNDRERAWEHMEQQLHTVRDQAHLWGPTALDYDVRPFNAWCLNPNCVNDLSEEERDDLFGDPNCDLSPGNFAAQLISEFVSPFEIVRINEVLMCRTLNWLSDLHRNVYEYIVKKFQFSIHLDKRWDSLLPEPEILHNELPL